MQFVYLAFWLIAPFSYFFTLMIVKNKDNVTLTKWTIFWFVSVILLMIPFYFIIDDITSTIRIKN